MRLIRADFHNYKSISGDSLDLENDITCLVGVNEAGKSNVLQALEKADNSKILEPSEYSKHSEGYLAATHSPQLSLLLETTDNAEKQILSEIFGVNTSKLLITKNGSEYRIDYPSVNYDKSSIKGLVLAEDVSVDPTSNIEQINVNDQEAVIKEASTPTTNPAQPAQQVEKQEDIPKARPLTEEQKIKIREILLEKLKADFIPHFNLFDSVNFTEYYLPENGEIVITDFINNPDSNKPVKNLLKIGGIENESYGLLTASSHVERSKREQLLNQASKQINEKMLKVIWPVETVEISLAADGDVLRIQLKESGNNEPFAPGERSRGLQWSLAFNTYFLAETDKDGKKPILLIDEPGVFLHINAQDKLLKNTFRQIATTGSQVIYTTHLPYLIDSAFPERVRILERDNEDTKIGNKPWSQSEFGLLPEPVKTALGLDWSSVVRFGDKNIVVEGPSDQIILRSLFSAIGLVKDVSYLPAYGWEKIPTILPLIILENKKFVSLVDADVNIRELKDKCSKVGVDPNYILSISDMNSSEVFTTEDLIPTEIMREAVFLVYEPLYSERRGEAFKREELPIEHPYVKTLEEYFTKKMNSKKHKLYKMDVARKVKYLIDKASRIDESKIKAAIGLKNKIIKLLDLVSEK